MSNLKITCFASGGLFGSGVYEIHGEGGEYRGTVPVSALREMGLVKRSDKTKRANEFLNTEEGRKWFLTNRRL